METVYSVRIEFLDGRKPKFHYATEVGVDSSVSAGLLVIMNGKTKTKNVYVISGNIASYEFTELTKEE